MSSAQLPRPQRDHANRADDLDDDTDFVIVEDDQEGGLTADRNRFKILVVDDDEDVHDATAFALRNIEILDRPVELLHTTRSNHALRLIAQDPDIAVALVDVVMETRDAGLRLIKEIRALGHARLRIILRTGQPGYAPELSVMQDYDINDYRTKTELTTTRLISTLIAAARSYEQLLKMEEMRSGLELVIHGMADLFKRETLAMFSDGVLRQLASLMHVQAHGLVCMAENQSTSLRAEDMQVVSGTGRHLGHHGRRLNDTQDPPAEAAFAKLCASGDELSADGHVALRLRSRHGRQLFVYLEVPTRIDEGDLSLLKVFSTNVAVVFENLQLLGRLDALAYTDPALNIPNGNHFERKLAEVLDTPSPDWAAALVNIDDMDSITCCYGIEMATAMAEQIYRQVSAVRGITLLAREREDRFAVLFDGSQIHADDLHRAFTGRLEVAGLALHGSATVAVVQLRSGGDNAQRVMQNLRAALTAARTSSRGSVYYYNDLIGECLKERVHLRSAMARSLTLGSDLFVALQPKVDISVGQIVGAEALSRWSPNGVEIVPAKFVPIVESSGLARALRDRVIEQIGEFQSQRVRSGRQPLPIAINLSLCDIHSAGFASTVLSRIEHSGLGPETLSFEITESGVMENLQHTIHELRVLKEAGYKIAVDDFGTGYSSLGYLELLPVDVLKIDRCFVAPLGVQSARRSIAGTTIAMAESLGLGIVAEGIETPQQHQALLFLGCQTCQGYYYGRPVPAQDFSRHYDHWTMPSLA